MTILVDWCLQLTAVWIRVKIVSHCIGQLDKGAKTAQGRQEVLQISSKVICHQCNGKLLYNFLVCEILNSESFNQQQIK